MTELVGYLVQDRIDYNSLFQGRYWDDFSPYGAFATIGWWPGEDDSPSQKSEFIEEAMSVYDRLRRKGCQDILMAMTLLSDAFDGYELKYLDRETSPTSLEDWLALAEVYDENEIRDRDFRERHKSQEGRIMGFIRGKNDSTEVETKGVLAVARIRSDLENVSGGKVQP